MKQIIVKDGDFDLESLVTKDEWIQTLSDKEFMSNNYKFALSVFSWNLIIKPLVNT